MRLHWNLVVHPLGDYVYSDMQGYESRADRMIERPDETYEYAAFFPYGNHFLLAALKLLFGKSNYVAISVVYAVLGTLLAPLTWAVAARASRFRWVPPAAGLVMVFYYPAISLGGYMLSEIPFAVCLTGALWLTLRLVDEGRTIDAWFTGVVCAMGITFRPQLAVTCVLFGIFWLVARRHIRKLRWAHLACVAIPILVVLAASAVRFHHHTGRLGLVSENGSLNLMFGRCHATKIESLPDDHGRGKVHFRPPPFLQLRNHEATHPNAWFKTDPALGYEIRYRGYIGDGTIHRRFIRKCIQKTGWLGQAEYSLTNIVLLWHYNIAWPDSGRSQWRGIARWWHKRAEYAFAVPSLFGLLAVFFPRRRPRLGVVALNLWALIVLAGVVFGGARHRDPYDPTIIVLALEVYAIVASWSWSRIRPFVLRSTIVSKTAAALGRTVLRARPAQAVHHAEKAHDSSTSSVSRDTPSKAPNGAVA